MIRALFHHRPPKAAREVLRSRPTTGWTGGGAQDQADRSAARALWVGRVMIAGLTLVFLGLLGRVAQLQTRPPGPIAQLKNTQTSHGSLMARPGAILDRQGRPLAVTRVAHRLFVDPYLITDRNTFSENVGYGLGYEPARIEQTLATRSHTRYVVLDHRMNDDRYTRFDKMKLSGLAVEPILVRDYPQGETAGQIMGFVGRAGNGLDGLERVWNDRLKGQAGSYTVTRDARRRAMWVQPGSYAPHTDGTSIRLSIDLNIQTLAEEALAQAIEKYAAESGQLVVMDPRTGEILAMANFPLFDPNHFSTAAPPQRRNRAVTDVFEPGSIFKAVVWAGLTDRGFARPHESIDCTTAGVWKPQRGPRLRDAHAHGVQTWEGVLIKSSNIGMGIVAERTRKKQLHQIVAAFGIGRPTGSGLPGETSGLLRKHPTWSYTDVTRIPMGQGVSVTALQMMRAFAVLAGDGVLVTPTIEALEPGYGAPDRMTQRVISPATAALTRRVLGRVVTEGTGRKARSDLYTIFGKTGTAQLPDFKNGGYHQDQYVSSFIAGAPLEDPRLVVGCFIQKPDKSIGHYGGTVSGPPVKHVIEQSLLYLGVSPRKLPPTDPAPPRVVTR